MKRFILIALTLGLLSLAAPAQAERFQVRCMTSHVATVDPIVAPGTVSAHEHEFFGNTEVNAFSTYVSMVASPTTCSTPNDTAGYWTPTLWAPDGSRVRAKSMLVYYRGKVGQHTTAFPADLRMVSDRFSIGANPSSLIVKFPECWNGYNLDDTRDHRSHMAFAVRGICPATHPVRVPAITEVFRYPVDVRSFHLSSGDFSTGHADFWNTWYQPALEILVERCLNGPICGRIDGVVV